MKKLKINLALSVGALVLCLAPYQPILADVAPPDGYVPVSYCFEIENLEKYPEYLFIAFAASENPSLPVNHAILNPDKCFDTTTGYRPISRVYALPKSAVKQEDIIGSPRRKEGEEILPLIYAVPKINEILPKIKDLNENDSRLIPSNLVIHHRGQMPNWSAGSRQFTRVYEIVSLSPKQLELKEQRIIDRGGAFLSFLGVLFGGLGVLGVWWLRTFVRWFNGNRSSDF